MLANVASKLIPSDDFPDTTFSVQLIFKPSIPDNVSNFRVFEDDEYIINFLTSKDTFKDSAIDDSDHDNQMNQPSV